MNNKKKTQHRTLVLIAAVSLLIVMSTRMRADTGICGGASFTLPFTDVQSSNIFFCSIAEAYFSGLTNGTSATTYAPTEPVPREQMAAFITRAQDSALKRGNRRAALQQWWTPTEAGALRAFNISSPIDIICDGADLWVLSFNASGTVTRVRASDGKLLGTWTGVPTATALIAAVGRIFIAGQINNAPGKIYVINPDASPGPVTVFEDDIGIGPQSITFDGANLWTANLSSSSISRVQVSTGVDSTYATGFSLPNDILWDGANLWVTDLGDDHLKRIDPSNGVVLESIAVGNAPRSLIFDGINIWMANEESNSISIVRAVGALRGTVLATLTGNGIESPTGMAFDGERVLVCSDGSVSLFKAADFSPLSNVPTINTFGAARAACSDGVNFWITTNTNSVFRF